MNMTKNSDFYFTTVTDGKRGQIVIPAKLRRELGIQAQEQLVVMSGLFHG
jgi:AbrB family looped-hinge helix DNA binding protein